MTAKLTPWFPADVKPVRVGVYERDDSATDLGNGHAAYSHWSGSKWGHLCEWTNQAGEFTSLISEYQDLPWRGLASDPAVSK
jgi:hypothetical protein